MTILEKLHSIQSLSRSIGFTQLTTEQQQRRIQKELKGWIKR